MLHRHVLISHLLCLVLRMNQGLIQLLSHILLPSLHLRTLSQCLLGPVNQKLLVDTHLLHKLQNQAVLLGKQRVEQMLLLNLLVSILKGCTLTVLNSL